MHAPAVATLKRLGLAACLGSGTLLLLEACSSSSSPAPAPVPQQVFTIGSTEVQVFPIPSAGQSVSATASFTGMTDSHRAAFDAAGNMYISDQVASKIYVWPPAAYASGSAGGTAPNLTISVVGSPFGIGFNSGGYLFVAGRGGSITIFAPIAIPSTTGNNLTPTPYATLSGASTTLNSPNGLAVDGSGNVYVANEGSAQVTIFAASDIATAYAAAGVISPTLDIAPSTTISGFAGLHALVLDSSGNLYVTDKNINQVDIFSAAQAVTGQGTVTPIPSVNIPSSAAPGSLTTIHYPNGIAVDREKNIYVADVTQGKILVFPAVTLGASLGVLDNVAPIATITEANLHGVSVH